MTDSNRGIARRTITLRALVAAVLLSAGLAPARATSEADRASREERLRVSQMVTRLSQDKQLNAAGVVFNGRLDVEPEWGGLGHGVGVSINGVPITVVVAPNVSADDLKGHILDLSKRNLGDSGGALSEGRYYFQVEDKVS